MMICSRAFRALLRRNFFIYRRRKPFASILEIFIPIALVMALVSIKLSLQNTEGFSPENVPPSFPNDNETFIPFSFTDYVTAIQAKRECIIFDKNSSIFYNVEIQEFLREQFGIVPAYDEEKFAITGIADKGINWMVPFVKCDSRACKAVGDDAKKYYCEYRILAVAAEDNSNDLATERAKGFKEYILNRHPAVQNASFLPGGYDFVQIFQSNSEINDYVKRNDYGETGVPKIGVAVIFSSDDGNPKAYDYTLRVNSTNWNAPEESARPAQRTTPPTDALFESFQKTDEDSCPLEDGTPFLGPFQQSCTWQYNYNGALTIQRLVGDFIIYDSGAAGEGYFVSNNGVQFAAFPTLEYVENGFYEAIAGFAPLLVTLGLLYPVSAVIRSITTEKELRQKELMKMMSVTESEIGWSWFVSYFVFHLVTTIGVTIATSALYSNSSPSILLFFWLLTFLSAIVIFGMLIASFLSRSTRATLIGVLLFFVGFFLTLASDFRTGNPALLSALSLHPVAAFSYGLQEIGRLEDLDVGVTMETISQTDSPSGYTFSSTLNSLMGDCIIWGIVTWYLNRVIPSDYGQALPWNFPFKVSYWKPSKRENPQPAQDSDSAETAAREMGILIEPVSDALKEQEREGKSIEIRGLRKQYGEKTAVDGLHLAMYSGQVTALLGHNGAGKTTTINMLTGMVAPTDGNATVCGKDIRTSMQEIRQGIGICLQHDCLFPLMTVKEHLQFFARIKGLYANKSEEEAETSIKTSMEDVALLEKSNTLSCNLSGGMKRKLSVAIAFCGDSKTVLLDEPTSGMDPFSRRFTWNVIRQYRQDRCIILTTHFMDEADILGDRIAIMSEGQLRCAGSPLFLKKSYGVGYQLTIEKKSRQSQNTSHTNAVAIDVTSAGIEKGYAKGVISTHDKQDNDDPSKLQSSPSSKAAKDEPAVVKAQLAHSNSDIDRELKNIVTKAVTEATVLSNVGTELSFQLPIGASSNFGPLFEDLDKRIDENKIVTYGVGITTLDEVFLMVARGETGEQSLLPSSEKKASTSGASVAEISHRSKIVMKDEGLFVRHVGALFKKRALSFKRDKKAWCCSVILPSLFVCLGLIVFTFVAPTRDLNALTLTLEDYNTNIEGTTEEPRNPIPFNTRRYTCQPGICSYQVPFVDLPNTTDETYVYCGYTSSLQLSLSAGGTLDFGKKETCSISQSTDISSRLLNAGARGIPSDVHDINASSYSLFETSSTYKASQYGALYFTHDTNSLVESSEKSYTQEAIYRCGLVVLLGDLDYTDQSECEHFGGIGYVVSYNFTSFHSALLYQALADEAIVREAMKDDNISVTATIHPLPITKVEENFGKAEDAFTAWFLMVVSFPFITGAFATFVVAERLSKAKHLQTVAGVKPGAYWLSTYMWDIMNYQFPLWITVMLFYAFDVKTFISTTRGIIGGVLVTLILFGPAGAGFTYCISFFFESPSLCNLFVIIFNFIIGMAGPLTSFILRLIGEDPSNPKDNLVLGADILEWLLRPIPSFCFGKALFNTINIEVFRYIEADPGITVWHEAVLLWEVIFLFIESFVYVLLAIQIDEWSTNPRAVSIWKKATTFKWLCGGRNATEGISAALPDDEDVQREAERVQSGDAIDDLIVVDQLTKQYPNGKLAVNNVSFGIPRGECFGLLGINGAGKTSCMAMLTAEFPPTSGDASLASFSVTKVPEMTRRLIGYCPQFDAHFMNMSGREHVELYASIKGIPLDVVKEAVAIKLQEVGLSEFDSDRLSMGYSGGMKRKLSVACATIGQPQIVFLDEPSTGMDPVARRDMWEVISDMVVGEGLQEDEKTSVILTTHSMEECEALCPRIAIMANGKLRCLGSAQHLKTRFGQGYQVELKIKDVEEEDEDYTTILSQLRGLSSGQEGGDEEAANANPEGVLLNVDSVVKMYQTLTGDDYLSSMVNPSDPTGYVIWKSASSVTGVPLHEVADFAAEELRMKKLKEFFAETYPNSILRERQDNKARYEVGSDGLKISSLFGTVEENKSNLNLSDYGISQTSLEQVFNMHAAEAEKLKHGTNDG